MLLLLKLGHGDFDGIPTRGLPNINIQRASGRKTSGRGDPYGGSFSKIQTAKYLHVIFMQAYQDSALSLWLNSYALRIPHLPQLPSPSCHQTPM